MTKLASAIKPGDVIDIHVHIGGPSGENESLYRWSEQFKKSPSFEGIKLVTKLSATKITGPRYMSVLFNQLKESRYVDKLVMLGLDEVYSEDGKKVPEKTLLFVSNEYLFHWANMYPSLLVGCSVHPYAPDALTRLWHCAKNGAVLCKWLPSSQAIDPTHPLAERFYRALALLDMPLLMHVGPEEAIPTALPKKDELLFNAAAGKYGKEPGDAISLALRSGAKVIVAHSATPLGPLFDKHNDYWEKVFDKLLQRVSDAADRYPLYADTSAFCLPGRFKYVEKVIPLAKELPERFLYGSDYPIPIVSFRQSKGLEEILDAFGWLASRVLPTNDLDKNHQLQKPHFSKQTFTAAVNVLRKPQDHLIDLDRYLKQLGVRKRRILWF